MAMISIAAMSFQAMVTSIAFTARMPRKTCTPLCSITYRRPYECDSTTIERICTILRPDQGREAAGVEGYGAGARDRGCRHSYRCLMGVVHPRQPLAAVERLLFLCTKQGPGGGPASHLDVSAHQAVAAVQDVVHRQYCGICAKAEGDRGINRAAGNVCAAHLPR